MIVIVDHDEVTQLQVSSGTGCFASNAFHSTTVSKEAICVVVNYIKAIFVEVGGGLSLGNSKPHGIREALTKGASSDLNAWSILILGVPRCNAINLLYASSKAAWLQADEINRTLNCFMSSKETPNPNRCNSEYCNRQP